MHCMSVNYLFYNKQLYSYKKRNYEYFIYLLSYNSKAYSEKKDYKNADVNIITIVVCDCLKYLM